jgi:hypothetical protein
VVNVVTATTEEISTTAIKLPALTVLLIIDPLSFPKKLSFGSRKNIFLPMVHFQLQKIKPPVSAQ